MYSDVKRPNLGGYPTTLMRMGCGVGTSWSGSFRWLYLYSDVQRPDLDGYPTTLMRMGCGVPRTHFLPLHFLSVHFCRISNRTSNRTSNGISNRTSNRTTHATRAAATCRLQRQPKSSRNASGTHPAFQPCIISVSTSCYWDGTGTRPECSENATGMQPHITRT